ncbi:MAG TPA: zinc ribbon domain-containing protein [Methanocorpusculum sp.]|nr:zinc ribbon domain-containing protein [Methanocorpusculum sp.]
MTEERNDDQILIRLPKSLKVQLETAARVEGMTVQDWVRKAMVNRISMLNVCPSCDTVNSGTAKFCNECGASLKDSKLSLYKSWMTDVLKEEFAEWESSPGIERLLEYLDDPAKDQKNLKQEGKWLVKEEKEEE